MTFLSCVRQEEGMVGRAVLGWCIYGLRQPCLTLLLAHTITTLLVLALILILVVVITIPYTLIGTTT